MIPETLWHQVEFIGQVPRKKILRTVLELARKMNQVRSKSSVEFEMKRDKEEKSQWDRDREKKRTP